MTSVLEVIAHEAILHRSRRDVSVFSFYCAIMRGIARCGQAKLGAFFALLPRLYKHCTVFKSLNGTLSAFLQRPCKGESHAADRPS